MTKRYIVKMIHTYDWFVLVEADSESEARKVAQRGAHISDWDGDFRGVNNSSEWEICEESKVK